MADYYMYTLDNGQSTHEWERARVRVLQEAHRTVARTMKHELERGMGNPGSDLTSLFVDKQAWLMLRGVGIHIDQIA